MSEHAQIDIRKGNTLVRIHSGWGTPRNILPALREAAASGLKTPLAIASRFMSQVKEASFGLSIIAEDFQRDALNFYYTVDVSTTPWKVVQEKCAGYRLIKTAREELKRTGMLYVTPDMIGPRVPARKRTLTIGAKATAAGK